MQPELLSYFHSVARRWDLMKDTYLQHTVQQATWDETTSTWIVQIVDHVEKRSFTVRSLAVVSAVGALSTPKKCDVPGHEDFEGKIFHSAQWDHSFDPAGKDILVLGMNFSPLGIYVLIITGNGCSATQFVPVLSQSAQTVAQVARQPHWLLERPNPKYSPAFKAAMRYIPGLMKLLRAKIFAELESEWPMFDSETGGAARAQLGKASEEYIRKVAPPKYVEALIPKFEVGCKRRVFDSDYLASLHRKNVELIHNDQVDRLTKTSAIFRSGRELKIDAVVLATGFETTALLSHLNIVGRNGISIQDHVGWTVLITGYANITQWRKHNEGFPQAYYGTCVAGFPNFFVMMGPNTVTGHSSVIFSSECQINFALNMLEPILGARRSRSIAAVEVTQQAEDQENSWIQQRAKGLVWSSGCSNWYVEPKTGKNLMVYPDWQWHYWLRSFAIDYSKFAYTGQDGRRISEKSLWQMCVSGLFMVLIAVHLL